MNGREHMPVQNAARYGQRAGWLFCAGQAAASASGMGSGSASAVRNDECEGGGWPISPLEGEMSDRTERGAPVVCNAGAGEAA